MPKGLRACLGRRMGLLRPIREKVDPRFLLFAYLGPLFQQEIRTRTNYGATVERIALKELPDFPIQIPPLPEQRAIAHILGSLDEKIELNRQMNATLEAMAQALFQSWFVDFDPVIDKALAAGNPIPEPLQHRAQTRRELGEKRKPLPAGLARHFPDRFVFTEELGWVPEGWEGGILSDVAELKTESILPGSQPEKEWIHYSIPAYDESKMPAIDLGDTIKSGKYRVPRTCVLASKLNPQFPRVWMPDVTDESSSICSTEFMPFVPLLENERPYLYELLCAAPVQNQIMNRVTGSTGSRQRVKPKEIATLPIVGVPKDVRLVFSQAVAPMLEKMMLQLRENAQTSCLRDTLLPKLLSGELRVPDAERLVAEAL